MSKFECDDSLIKQVSHRYSKEEYYSSPLKSRKSFNKQTSIADSPLKRKRTSKSKEKGESTAEVSDNNLNHDKFSKKKSLKSQYTIKSKQEVVLEDTNRTDYYGNKIFKRGKQHKVVFRDNFDGGHLEEVIEIKKLIFESNSALCSNPNAIEKEALLPGNGLMKNENQKGSRAPNEDGGKNENCTCLCFIF